MKRSANLELGCDRCVVQERSVSSDHLTPASQGRGEGGGGKLILLTLIQFLAYTAISESVKTDFFKWQVFYHLFKW